MQFLKKKTILLFLALLLSHPLGGQEKAKITDFAGKVTIRTPGGEWKPVEPGVEISVDTTLSTGFNSHAVLDLGTSELYVRQLTRMTLEELTRSEGTITTKLFLNVGKVRAKVKTGEDLTHDFHLRSTVSTVSVRGTDLEFDGELVRAFNDVLFITNLIGQERRVSAGETVRTERYTPPDPPVVYRIESSEVAHTTAKDIPSPHTLSTEQILESLLVTENTDLLTVVSE